MFTVGSRELVDLLSMPTPITARVNGIALDATGTLYVTQQGQVKRCAIAGGKCTFTTIATTPGIATDVAVDATTLYWGTDDGSVWRLRKR